MLGDVNGDGLQDYAVGMPYADAAGADSGIVYVFLGRPGALAPTPTAVNVASASFTITGHGGELLGFSVTGGDFNGDGRADIGIGAPMGNGPQPGRRGRRLHRLRHAHAAQRLDHGAQLHAATRTTRRTRRRTRRSAAATRASSPTPTPGPPWPRCPTSTATTTRSSRSACPTRTCTSPAEAAQRCSTASPRASTSTSPTCGRPGIRTTSTSTSRRSTTSTSARPSRACPT